MEIKLEKPPFLEHIMDKELAHHATQALTLGVIPTTLLANKDGAKNDIEYTFIDNFNNIIKWVDTWYERNGASKYTPIA